KKHNKHRIWSFVMARKKRGDDLHSTLIKFTKPEEMNGIGILAIGQPETDDIWFYIPDLKRAKRIITPERSPSFLGSDFAYEDLEAEEMKDYDYERVGMGLVLDKVCFKIRATPRSPKKMAATAYGSRVLWIRKDNYFKMAEDYYDKKGALLKTAFYAEPQRMGRGKYKMISVSMLNRRTGTTSILRVSPKTAKYEVPESMFTVEYLEEGIVY
ncbi:MAG: outer membrane lipoprotein-sorting protein, partial [Pseudomonadota bacterium]